MNVMRLDHPETNPHPRSVEELSSMKLVPAAKKIGDHWIRRSLTAFKPDSRCVGDLGSTPSPLVNPSVPCCHQSTAIAVETGETLFILLMIYLWSMIGSLFLPSVYMSEEETTHTPRDLSFRIFNG